MTETLETGEVLEKPLPRPLGLTPLAPQPLAPRRTRPRSLRQSASEALERRRSFVLLPFAMIAGLIVSLELPTAPDPIALAIGGAGLAVGLAFSLRSLDWVRMAVLAIAFWVGLCLLPIHGALFGTAMLGRPAYGSYQGRVDEVLSDTPGEARVVLSDLKPTAGDRLLPMRRARVFIRNGPSLAPGDVISGSFRFSPVPGPVYPGGFDTQFHSYFDGIGAYGNSIRAAPVLIASDTAAPARFIDTVRRGIAVRVDRVLAQPAAGVARAIINGDESEVTDEARTTMATAGIAHVLSVSGLHLTIVAGGVFAALRLLLAGFSGLATRVSAKRLAAAGGMAAALFYFAISGGNVAAFRSTLMILLVFGAVLFGRRALTMRNVAIAGLIVVATDPASVFRPSFELSFAAVVALIGAYENLRSSGGREGSLISHVIAYVRGIVITSLVAGAATVLFSIYYFQQTSPLGVLGNLGTLPLVGFIMMPAAVIAVLLMPFGLDEPPLLAMGWSIDRMLDMAGIVASWSTHLRAAPLLTPWALVIGLVALGWFAFFKDRWRLLGPGLAVPLVALFCLDHSPDVMISDTTQAMVVRGASGLELADGKPQSFALDVWRETYADPIATKAAETCDSIACIGQSSAGFSYAVIDDPAGFADECGSADLIVARIPAPTWCKSKAVIDQPTLLVHGVQWLRWNAGQQTFEIRAAVPDLNRPWRIGG